MQHPTDPEVEVMADQILHAIAMNPDKTRGISELMSDSTDFFCQRWPEIKPMIDFLLEFAPLAPGIGTIASWGVKMVMALALAAHKTYCPQGTASSDVTRSIEESTPGMPDR